MTHTEHITKLLSDANDMAIAHTITEDTQILANMCQLTGITVKRAALAGLMLAACIRETAPPVAQHLLDEFVHKLFTPEYDG